jgi:hypothetical protein
MLTTDEVRAIPILSAVPTGDLERLAKSAADIQLAAANGPFTRVTNVLFTP